MHPQSSDRIIAIDARPRGPHGPLGGASVLGRTVLSHLVDAARKAGVSEIAVYSNSEETTSVRDWLSRESSTIPLTYNVGEPPQDAFVLRTDRLYDPVKLRRAIGNGRSLNSAVVWRLDGNHLLAGAADELIRRTTYQPIGRFWAFNPAKLLAGLLTETRIRPNHLTAIAAISMLASAALIAFAQPLILRTVLPAALMAIALIVDTADGHLARLQGTASRVGRWLDATLDELGDMALHAGVAWAAFRSSGDGIWLVVGMAYGMSKYLFFASNTIWDDGQPPQDSPAPSINMISPWSLRGVAHWLGHADVRWHTWILLALVGGLKIELVAATIYFILRFAAGSWRKAGAHR